MGVDNIDPRAWARHLVGGVVDGGLNPDDQEDGRRIAGYKRWARVRQSSGLAGESAVRQAIMDRFPGGRATLVDVVKRGGVVPVVDLLFEVDGGLILIEAKANDSPLGKSNQTAHVDGEKIHAPGGRKTVLQLTPEWLDLRLDELRTRHGDDGIALAKKIHDAWTKGKLRVLLGRAPDIRDGLTHVTFDDLTDRFIAHKNVPVNRAPHVPGVTAPHAPSAPHPPVAPVQGPPANPTNLWDQPGRLLNPPPSDADRGLAPDGGRGPRSSGSGGATGGPGGVSPTSAGGASAPTSDGGAPPRSGAASGRAPDVPDAQPPPPPPPQVPANGSASAASEAGDAARGGLRSLARKLNPKLIGLGAWKAVRAGAKFAVMSFLQMGKTDFVLAVAFAWIEQILTWKARAEKPDRDKQRALEAALKQGPAIEKLISAKILNDAQALDGIVAAWDTNKGTGFLYARLEAEVEVEMFFNIRNEEVEPVSVYRPVTKLDVRPTSTEFDHELTVISSTDVDVTSEDVVRNFEAGAGVGYIRKVLVKKRLKYTFVPPIVTPFDILVSKINNLFLDSIYFIGSFTTSGVFDSFTGFDYRYPYKDQFTVWGDFPSALKPGACHNLLGYLHWAAKILSKHPLEQVDIYGQLQDPRRGLVKRLGLLQSVTDGQPPDYRTFKAVKRYIKDMDPSDKSNDVLAAQEALQEGADHILFCLGRVARAIRDQHAEYYYMGPKYKPPKR
jgi:hypothetical protein